MDEFKLKLGQTITVERISTRREPIVFTSAEGVGDGNTSTHPNVLTHP